MSEQHVNASEAAGHLWAADILRVIRLGVRDWDVVRHGQVKQIRDATRMAERLYIKGMGWR